ncbi:MAG: LysR family transcriptional regulator [Cellvibrionaceae bacterium]
MNWDNLRFFIAVARQGSLSAAARQLNVSQATAWRKIFALETELNTSLFHAGRSGYSMTASGLQLLPLAEQMALTADQVNRSLQQPDSLSGNVRVTAPDILANHLVNALVLPLQSQYSQLTVELITSSPSAPLSSRDTDIGIFANKSYSSQMVLLAQYKLPFALYAASTYVKAYVEEGKPPESLHDLANHKLIDFDYDAEHLAPAGWFKKAAAMTRVFRSNNPVARKNAAKQGLGLALLPCLFVQPEDGLEKIIAEDDIGELSLFLTINQNKQSFPNVLEVSQQLQTILKQLLR